MVKYSTTKSMSLLDGVTGISKTKTDETLLGNLITIANAETKYEDIVSELTLTRKENLK